MEGKSQHGRRAERVGGALLLVGGFLILGAMIPMLRLAAATDYAHHSLMKDPQREAPAGPVMVSPADGTVLYVRRIENGIIPEVVKEGIAVPVSDHLKGEPERPFGDGYLIGIYMNTQGIHLNSMPNRGTVKRQLIFNGPHMNMGAAEVSIILTQLVPGLVTARKLLGVPPFDLEHKADFVLKSARETLVVEDERGAYFYIVRIADYYAGKILTWVAEGDRVLRGQKIGMITWGSQTDLFIEESPGLAVTVEVGDYLYGGESIVATY